jgi:hypothetical protein
MGISSKIFGVPSKPVGEQRALLQQKGSYAGPREALTQLFAVWRHAGRSIGGLPAAVLKA